MPDQHPPAGDLADYWTTDLSADAVEGVEAHVFACAECAEHLASTHALIEAIRDLVRSGRSQAIVTDAVLNRLAREGARMRMFSLEPGAATPCAVWADDDLIVVRMRADFTGVRTVTLVTQLAGQEIERIADVPLRAAAGELIQVFSAGALRHVPRTEVRLQLFGSRGNIGADEMIAEYVLEHAGSIDRATPMASG